jgi:hypothetical protein
VNGHVALEDHVAGEELGKGDFGLGSKGGSEEAEGEAKLHGVLRLLLYRLDFGLTRLAAGRFRLLLRCRVVIAAKERPDRSRALVDVVGAD